MEDIKISFSVCTSVYKNDNPLHIREAFDSLLNQTVLPNEIIVIVDGPVSCAIKDVLFEYSKNDIFNIKYLDENIGLGRAMNLAVRLANNEYIARMDSDDIALPDRFEKQLAYLRSNPKVSVLGGQITEFIDSPSNVVAKRVCPIEHKEILAYMTRRCPFNHMTVMFKKSDIVSAGNYIDWNWNEDYFLWLRLMKNGALFHNLGDTLVNVRVGKDMYARRGGAKYFKSEYRLQKYMYKKGIIGFFKFCVNVATRFVIQIMLSNKIRGWVYRLLLRR